MFPQITCSKTSWRAQPLPSPLITRPLLRQGGFWIRCRKHCDSTDGAPVLLSTDDAFTSKISTKSAFLSRHKPANRDVKLFAPRQSKPALLVCLQHTVKTRFTFDPMRISPDDGHRHLNKDMLFIAVGAGLLILQA